MEKKKPVTVEEIRQLGRDFRKEVDVMQSQLDALAAEGKRQEEANRRWKWLLPLICLGFFLLVWLSEQ